MARRIDRGTPFTDRTLRLLDLPRVVQHADDIAIANRARLELARLRAAAAMLRHLNPRKASGTSLVHERGCCS